MKCDIKNVFAAPCYRRLHLRAICVKAISEIYTPRLRPALFQLHHNHGVSNLDDMKRKSIAPSSQKPKRVKEPEADYCDVSPRTDGDGHIIWPASSEAMQSARDFLNDW